jgi:hypothetical protein
MLIPRSVPAKPAIRKIDNQQLAIDNATRL